MKKLLFTLVWVVVLVSCKKTEPIPEPEVDFVATDDGYGAVQFYTTATNADSYAWDFGDGRSDSTSATPLHSYRKNGTFKVTLVARGPGGTTTLAKDVIVTGVRGSVTFWKSSGTRSLEVYVDEQYVGVTITNYPQGVKACGVAGSAVAEKLTEGVHRYRAKEQSGLLPRTYEGNFVVVAGQCSPVQVTTAR